MASSTPPAKSEANNVVKRRRLHIPQGLCSLVRLTSHLQHHNKCGAWKQIEINDFLREAEKKGLRKVGSKVKFSLSVLKQQERLIRILVACLEMAHQDAIIDVDARSQHDVGGALMKMATGKRRVAAKARNFVNLLCMVCHTATTALRQGHGAATEMLKQWSFQAEQLAVGAKLVAGTSHAGKLSRFMDTTNDSEDQRRVFATLSTMKRAINASFLPKNAAMAAIKGYCSRMLSQTTRVDPELLVELRTYGYGIGRRGVKLSGDIPETGAINDKACIENSRKEGGTRQHMRNVTALKTRLLPPEEEPKNDWEERDLPETFWARPEVLGTVRYKGGPSPGRYLVSRDSPYYITDPPGVERDMNGPRGPKISYNGPGAMNQFKELSEFSEHSYSTRTLAEACAQAQNSDSTEYGVIRTRPSAIKERGMKTRVVSLFPACYVVVAQRVNRSLLAMLRSDPAHYQDRGSDLTAMLGTVTEERQLYSADLSCASDYLQHSACRALMSGIFEGIRSRTTKETHPVYHDDNVFESVLEMISGHKIEFKTDSRFPEESGQIEKMISDSVSGGVTTQGTPMGLGITWPVLAMIHRYATIRRISRKDQRRVALKGDDALLNWTRESYQQYIQNLGDLGLVINQTKTHESKTGGIFCGKFVRMSSSKYEIFNSPKASAIILAKRDGGGTEEAEDAPAEVVLGPAITAELTGCPQWVRSRVMKTVNWYHAGMLARMRKTGIPIYFPRSLGGFALPGRCKASRMWRVASANYVSGHQGQSGNPIGWGALWTMKDDETEMHRNARCIADEILGRISEVAVTARGKGGTIRNAHLVSCVQVEVDQMRNSRIPKSKFDPPRAVHHYAGVLGIEGNLAPGGATAKGKVYPAEGLDRKKPNGVRGPGSGHSSNRALMEIRREKVYEKVVSDTLQFAVGSNDPNFFDTDMPVILCKDNSSLSHDELQNTYDPGTPDGLGVWAAYHTSPSRSWDSLNDRCLPDPSTEIDAIVTGTGRAKVKDLREGGDDELSIWIGLPERKLRTALMTVLESRLRQTSVYSSNPYGKVLDSSDPDTKTGKPKSNFLRRAARVLQVAHRLHKSNPGKKPVNEEHVRKLAADHRCYGERLLSIGGVVNVCAYLGIDFRKMLTNLENDTGEPPAWCRLEREATPDGAWGDDVAVTAVMQRNDQVRLVKAEQGRARKAEFTDRTVAVDHAGSLTNHGTVRTPAYTTL